MRVKDVLLLLLTASIWGMAFVAQSVGMDYVGPFAFNCVRCLMGGVVLPLCIWFFDRRNKKRKQAPAVPGVRKTLVMGGICYGAASRLAGNSQQLGVQYTIVGEAGFVTACCIVIAPMLGLLLGKKCSPVAVGTVVLSLAGLCMLCVNGGGLSVNKGDLLILVCAFLFTVHVMVIDFFPPAMGGIKMSCIQFFVSEILSGGAMLVNETPGMSQIVAAWAPVLYAGIMSYGVAYTLQITGQKGINSTVASLILSLRSSVSALAGWMILGQRLSSREVLGCILIFDVIILAQILAG